MDEKKKLAEVLGDLSVFEEEIIHKALHQLFQGEHVPMGIRSYLVGRILCPSCKAQDGCPGKEHFLRKKEEILKKIKRISDIIDEAFTPVPFTKEVKDGNLPS